MSSNVKKRVQQGLLTLPLVAFISGCGLAGSSADSSTDNRMSSQTAATDQPEVRVAGAAVKGVIRQGLVTANRLVSDKSGTYQLDRLATKPVRTDNDGRYELRLRGQAEGWALVELTADASTRMVCDVVPACEQASGETVAFGQPFQLDSAIVLRGAGDLTRDAIYLTPLSQLAIALAERATNGYSPESLQAAYQTVENWFGLSAGALRLAPPDLTQLDQAGDVSADALQVAVMNAAFLAVVNNNARWSSLGDVLDDMAGQITQTGQLAILGDGSNLALSDILAAAAVQASDLQQTVASGTLSQKLVIVEYRNVQRFKTIAGVYGTDGSTVADGSGTTGATGDTVAGLPANSALLSWQAPLTRENGVSLSMGEIAGYEVGYGPSPDNLSQSLAIGDAYVDELLIDELSAGTWYFAVRTLDTEGNRSRWSEVVSKVISI